MKTKGVILSLCLCLGMLADITLAKVRIMHPSDLKEKLTNDEGILESGMANFGHIDYGSTIVSTDPHPPVLYTPPNPR